MSRFVPRSLGEHLGNLAHRVIARSKLRDLTPSSTLLALLYGVAQGLASQETLLDRMYRAFFLGGEGALLDARGADFPDGSLARQGATAAAGAVLQVTRTNTAQALTLEPGWLVSRSDDPSVIYRVSSTVSFAAGVATVSDVSVVAQAPGASGSCRTGTITRLTNAHADVIAVTNLAPLEGQDAEEDDRYRRRLSLWLASLAGSQPDALLGAALAFVASDRSRVRFAHVYEDPRRPGYTEVIVDDGSGGAGGTARMAASSGTVGAGGALMLWHQAPATRPVDVVRVTLAGGGERILRASDGEIVSCPERGVVWVFASLGVGDVWRIDTDGQGVAFEVYTGLVAQLQELIEGDVSAMAVRGGARRAGKRAAGTRVVVRPARVQHVSLDLHVVPRAGVDLAALRDGLREATLRHFQSLAPGETLRASALTAVLHGQPGVVSVRIYRQGTRVPLEDFAPAGHDRSLRSTASRIGFVPAAEESA